MSSGYVHAKNMLRLWFSLFVFFGDFLLILFCLPVLCLYSI
jgi:hypothetical protein